MLIIENINRERLDNLTLAYGEPLRLSKKLRQQFDKMEDSMEQITMWCNIRPRNQMSFTVRILRVLSVFLVAEATALPFSADGNRWCTCTRA